MGWLPQPRGVSKIRCCLSAIGDTNEGEDLDEYIIGDGGKDLKGHFVMRREADGETALVPYNLNR